MVVLPMQYIIFLVYKTTQAASIEVLRRVLLDRYVGIGFSSAKLLIISIIMLLFSITLSKLITFSIGYLPEILVLFINSTVLTIIGYFRGFKSQLVLSILNIFLFSISPILLNVMGAIKYMLESFIIFTQFLVFYYFNTMNADIKHINEYVLLSRFREVIRAMFSILSKIFFVAAIIFMISFLIGFRGLAIVSNSMSPTINRGDLVFIDINDHEVNKGDIIAFTYEDKIILHRVYRVDNQTYTILTKGDANKNIDPWIVTNNNYVGKYVFSIPLLGYPSIFLSSLFTNPVISISLTVILILAFLIIILMKEMV
ncbi:MAG: signal peptidase I [Staphylothermus sp.]|nr:signal peptidase I [Staphylothermus sp.]